MNSVLCITIVEIHNQSFLGPVAHECGISCEDVMWYYFVAILMMVVVLTLSFAIIKYIRHLNSTPKSGNFIISVDEITPACFDD